MIGFDLNTIIMGLVEGVTEFLPVSSTGHLLMMDDLLDFQGPPGHVFDIVIQLGAILAVVVVYFHKLLRVTLTFPKDAQARQFIYAVLLGFMPAIVIGAFAHDFIKTVLFNTTVVCWSLLLGGIAMLWIEKHAPTPKVSEVEELSWKTSLAIGFCQCLAMIPGVSRSGATIMGALMLKVDRKTAAEFSFFLAIPTMAGATAYDLYKNIHDLTGNDMGQIAVGFVVAFVSALVVVRSFVGFISKHGFAPFAWYRIAVGAVGLAALFFSK